MTDEPDTGLIHSNSTEKLSATMLRRAHR